ncbi:MAG: hypothetical protein SGBAC_008596 [Bacillariaceae sp.]
MDSTNPAVEGILGVFKLAANALADAPNLEHSTSTYSDSSSAYENADAAGVSKEPVVSKSYTNSSGADTRGSSSVISSYDELSGESNSFSSCESASLDNHAAPGDEDSDVFDGVVTQERDSFTHHGQSQIADALSMSKRLSNSEDVEVTAEDSFRQMRTFSSHRRHLPLSFGMASKKSQSPPKIQREEMEETAALVGDVKMQQRGRQTPPLPVKPRSVSMVGVGNPLLMPNQQKRRSLFTRPNNRSTPKSTESPGGQSAGHSGSSSFSFGFPSRKLAEKQTPPKSTRFVASEERDQVGSHRRTHSSSERRGRNMSNPTMLQDSNVWQWDSSTSPAQEGRHPSITARTPLPPSEATLSRSIRVACTEPERSIVQEKPSVPTPEKVSQLLKVAKKSHEVKRLEEESTPEFFSTTETAVMKKSATSKKEKFSRFFGKHDGLEAKYGTPNSMNTPLSDKEEAPLTPTVAPEVVEMISNLFKMSMPAGEEVNKEKSSGIINTMDAPATTDSSVQGDNKNKKHTSFFRSSKKKKKEVKGEEALRSTKKDEELAPIEERPAVSMLAGLFKMSFPHVAEPNENNRDDINETMYSTSVSTEESIQGDKKKKTGKVQRRNLSRISFFGSSKKKKKIDKAPKPTKKEPELAPIEEKPAEIYDLTNWLWSPFVFPTDESAVGPNDEPIVVILEDDIKSDRNKKGRKGLRTWARRGKKTNELRSYSSRGKRVMKQHNENKKKRSRDSFATRRSSSDEQDMKQNEKKKQSRQPIANRAAKGSTKNRKAGDLLILRNDHGDNFVQSTHIWS